MFSKYCKIQFNLYGISYINGIFIICIIPNDLFLFYKEKINKDILSIEFTLSGTIIRIMRLSHLWNVFVVNINIYSDQTAVVFICKPAIKCYFLLLYSRIWITIFFTYPIVIIFIKYLLNIIISSYSVYIYIYIFSSFIYF